MFSLVALRQPMTSQTEVRCLSPEFQGNALGLSKSSKEEFLCSFGQKQQNVL